MMKICPNCGANPRACRCLLAIVALLVFVLPASAQSLPERLAQVERNNAALSEKMDAIAADVATLKMNVNGMAAKIDAFDAKLQRAMKPAAVEAWASSPATSAWSETPASSGWSSSAGTMRARPMLFPRLRGRAGSCGAGG